MNEKTQLSPEITLPSGRKGTMKEFKETFRAVFGTEHGQVVLDFLRWKAQVNQQFDKGEPNPTACVYNLARHEFVAMIESMARGR